MGDDWSSKQRDDAVEGQESGGEGLGARWIEMQACLEHIREDWHDESEQEAF